MIGNNGILASTMLILYACTVMYMLLDVHFSQLPKNKKLWGTVFFLTFIALNIYAKTLFGHAFYGKFYLILTQLPVFLIFRYLSNYRGMKLLFVLLTTVFLSAPITILHTILQHLYITPIWTKLLVFLLLLGFINNFFKKPFNNMLNLIDNTSAAFFSVVPLLYYVYSYGLTKYQFNSIVINQEYFFQQIPMLIVLTAYILLIQIFKMLSEKSTLQKAQDHTNMRLDAAKAQIDQLRDAEKQSAIYRHDLRHHMNYLSECIKEKKLEEATNYINQICTVVDKIAPKRYSVNEEINLLLSSYISKATTKNIQTTVNVTATHFSQFQITDLCSLLANCLENAINGCEGLKDDSKKFIRIRIYEKSSRLYFEIYNSYYNEPTFKNLIPVSQKEGHGIGVQSIVHVAEKYDGIYLFSAKNGEFCFQMSAPLN